MRTTTIILSALLTVFTFVTAAPLQDLVKFFLVNNCGFDVYVREAIGEHPGYDKTLQCADFGESREVKLEGHGNAALASYPVLKDTCGHSVKVARYPGGPVYQFEFTWALENDKMWYDLSHEDGHPFTDVEREMAPHNGCTSLRCNSGNDGSQCDYNVQTDCGALGAILGFLCGRGQRAFEGMEQMAVPIKDLTPV